MPDAIVERLPRMIEVMQMIQSDAESDALALDGKPLDGRTVGRQFGNVFAAINSLAIAVELLATELLSRDEVPA